MTRDFLEKRQIEETHAENFICETCGQGFARKSTLTRHIEENHIKGDEFNCDKSDFKTTTRNLLDKHKVLTGHMPDIVERKQENQYKCRNCPEKLSEFNDMMVHRKENHMVRECKNLPNCDRGESCWYKHQKEVVTEASETSEPVSKQTPTTSESQKFKCRICDNDFSGKSALMEHKKTDHIDRVRQCTDFASNYCRRGDLQCTMGICNRIFFLNAPCPVPTADCSAPCSLRGVQPTPERTQVLL